MKSDQQNKKNPKKKNINNYEYNACILKSKGRFFKDHIDNQ